MVASEAHKVNTPSESMSTIALIPTGKMEHAALGAALGRLFPDHCFIVRPPEMNLDGFTSRDVSPLVAATAGPVPTSLDELAKELVNSILPSRRGRSINYAYVVEDLELCNQHQPELVLRIFRDAVEGYIHRTWPQQSAPIFAAIRERCSFHLFRPMTEAYFFGEAAALQRANAVQEAKLPANLDLEHFYTTDPDYLNFPSCDRITDMPMRQNHPKAYIHFLCDPTLSNKKLKYRESQNGVQALSLLDWEQVLSAPPHCPFLHAFLDDLGAALDSPLPFVNAAHPDERVRFPGPQNRLLRNL